MNPILRVKQVNGRKRKQIRILSLKTLLLSLLLFTSFALFNVTVRCEKVYPTSLKTECYAKMELILDWNLFWSKFKQHSYWNLEWYNGAQWVSKKSDLTIQRNYIRPNVCKLTLIFNGSRSGSYRLTFAIDQHARNYMHKEGSYNYTFSYKNYAVIFDWSDVMNIPNLIINHGIKNVYGENWFWFRIRKDNIPQGAYLEIDPTLTAYATSSDGHIPATSTSNYTDAWTSEVGDLVSDSAQTGVIGQTYNDETSSWIVYRGFLFFDTSSLSDCSLITAKLRLYGQTDFSITDFNITIQNGQPSYPHDPMTTSDFSKSLYSGNGGIFDTNGFSTSAYNNITLTSNAVNWINQSGTTKLCLRSNRDISGIEPTGNEKIYFHTSENSEGQTKAPKLIVTYLPPTPDEEQEAEIEDWYVQPDQEPLEEITETITKDIMPTLKKYGFWIIIGFIGFIAVTTVIVNPPQRKSYRKPTGKFSRPRGPTGKLFRPRGPDGRFKSYKKRR